MDILSRTIWVDEGSRDRIGIGISSALS